MNNVLVVANFSAGRKQAIKYKKKIQKFLLIRQMYFRFINIDQLQEVDMDLFDTILVVGGDGTVNKVLPYLVNTNKTLGIIPCGTANLLASKLGINSISKALKVIDKENIRKIDVMTVNDNLSVLRCGIGYDADIIGKTPQSLKNKFGYFAYFVAGIIFALRLSTKTYEITCDNKSFLTDATCIIVGNASNMYRNIVTVAKNSELNDGYFDIFILEAKNTVTFIYEFLRIVLGIKKDNKRAKYFKAKSLNIKNHWTLCHLDGEKTKFKDDININIVSNAINVFF